MLKKIGGFMVFMIFIWSVVLYGVLPDKKCDTTNSYRDNNIEAATLTSRSYVYLINPMMARMFNGDVKIIYRIEIYGYVGGNPVISVRPVLSSIFGKEMIIPYYNIRAIVKGNNKFKEHLIEREW